MAKTRGSNNLAAFVLEFLGSLIYLGLVFGTGTSLLGGGVWLPVLWATAVVSAIALFFVSFTNLTGMANGWSSMKLSALGGFALIALAGSTVGTSSVLYWAAILGFVLSFLGSGFTWKK